MMGMVLHVLEIRLFGPLNVVLRDESLPRVRTRSSSWLLALLALRLGREVSREWLSTVLWPDSDREPALYNLRRCLVDLRRAFGADAGLLQTPTRQTVSLKSEGVWVDVLAFEQALEGKDSLSLEKSLELYRGPLLEDCSEEWAVSERAAYESKYLAALKTLTAQALSCNDPMSAVRYLRLAVTADPLMEENQRALMQALADCGDFAAATKVDRDLRMLLHRELNASPAPETDQLYRRLQELAKHAVLPSAPISYEASQPPRRLPVPINRA